MALDITKIAERLAQLNSGGGNNGGGTDYFKIKDGRNVVRILPPKDENEMFFQEAYLHYGVNKSEENKKGMTIVCPTTFGEGKPCPVCELSKQMKALSRKKDDTYDKQARELMRKKRAYFNVIDRSDDLATYSPDENGKLVRENSEGYKETPVKVMSTGVSILKDLLGIIVDPEYGDITDAEEGLDVIITKSGTGFNTEYDVKTVRKESAIGFDAWSDCLYDLSKISVPKTYDEIANMLDGGSEEPSTPDKSESVEDKTPVAPPTAPEGGTDLDAEIAAALARRQANQG